MNGYKHNERMSVIAHRKRTPKVKLLDKNRKVHLPNFPFELTSNKNYLFGMNRTCSLP